MRSFVSVAKYVLSLAIAVALMYWVFSNIDWQVFRQKASEVNYLWVLLSILLSLVAYYARAYRWNILLQPLGYSGLSLNRTAAAVLVGYLANLALPRLGEVTRCGMLKRSDDVAISSAFGTVISERIIDLFTLIVLFLIALLLEHDQLIAFLEQDLLKSEISFSNVWNLVAMAILLGLLGIAVVWIAIVKIPKVKLFVLELWAGLISLRGVKKPMGFLVSTLILWIAYYFMSYLIVYALPETSDLNWEVGIMLLVTGGIALSIPVQGGFGTYHALISAMLSLYFVEINTGVFLATVLHTSQIVAVAIFGGVALLISIFTQRKSGANKAENSDQKGVAGPS